MYLILDCEMGGLGDEFSLLTLYMAKVNEKFNIIDELDLQLTPDDDKFVSSVGGMSVNKIDLANWQGVPYKQAKKAIREFLVGDRLVPIGHGVKEDLRFISLKLDISFDERLSNQVLDTFNIATFLQDASRIKPTNLSLGGLAEYFGVSPTGELHTAKVDAILGLDVYKKMRRLIK